MSTELAVDAFWSALGRSGILPADKLQKLQPELLDRSGGSASSRAVADDLVSRGLLTRWQADKLLEGKYRGFILGPYRLLDPLGRGGMGLVYLAEHTMMRRRCAIKVLPSKLAEDPSVVDRFYREAQAVAALDHPNIVRAYDVNKAVQDGTETHYLVMEFVDGRDMQRKVEEGGVLGFREAAELIRQAAEGLAHAHAVGIIHRDVKPANLLVDRNGTVRLLDLGLATFFNDPEEAAAAAQQGRTVVGTADYLAPEQAVDSNKIDARADIYSLGMTFYFLLTGHAPYPTGTIIERLMAHQTRSPELVEKTRPDAPPGLLAKLYKMIARKADQRYQSAREVADALAAWLKDNPADSGVLRRLGRLESVMRLAAQRAARGPGGPSSDDTDADLDFAPTAEEEPRSNGSGSGIRGKRSESAAAQSGDTASALARETASGPSSSKERLHGAAAAAPHAVVAPAAPLPAGAPTVDDMMEVDSVPSEPNIPVLASPLSGPAPTTAPATAKKKADEKEEKSLLQSPWVWVGAIVPVAALVIVLVYALQPSDSGQPIAVAPVTPGAPATSLPAAPPAAPPATPAQGPSVAAPSQAPAPPRITPSSSPATPQTPAPGTGTAGTAATPTGTPTIQEVRPDLQPAPVPQFPPTPPPSEPPKPQTPPQPAPASQPAAAQAQPANQPKPEEPPKEQPSPPLTDQEKQRLLAELTEIGFTLTSFDKGGAYYQALVQRSVQVAERARLRTSTSSLAVMQMTLKAEKAGGKTDLVLTAELKCPDSAGNLVTVWKHEDVVATVGDVNHASSLKTFRSGLNEFFSHFVDARKESLGPLDEPRS